MSKVDKEILFDEDVIGLGDDRVGLLARLAYVGALAGHVAASDGTIEYGDTVLRLQLLPGIEVSPAELNAVRERLAAAGLIVPYSTGGKRYAFVSKWPRYNGRFDRARRGTKNPPVPADLLVQSPDFATFYGRLTPATRGFPEDPGASGKRPESPGVSGTSDPETVPAPVNGAGSGAASAPASASVPAPVSVSASASTPTASPPAEHHPAHPPEVQRSGLGATAARPQPVDLGTRATASDAIETFEVLYQRALKVRYAGDRVRDERALVAAFATHSPLLADVDRLIGDFISGLGLAADVPGWCRRLRGTDGRRS